MSCGAKISYEKEEEKKVEIKKEEVRPKVEEKTLSQEMEEKSEENDKGFGSIKIRFLVIMIILQVCICLRLYYTYREGLIIVLLPSMINAIVIGIMLSKLNK